MDKRRSPPRLGRLLLWTAGLVAVTLIVLAGTGSLSQAARQQPEDILGGWGNLTTTNGNNAVALAANSQTTPAIYASTYDDGVFASLNGGATWSNPLAESTLALATGAITPTVAYAGTFSGSFWRTANGTLWTEHSSGLGANIASAILATSPITLYLGTDGAVYVSDDGGDSWFPTGSGIPGDALVQALEQDNGVLVAGIDQGGAFRSLDNGDSWIDATTGLGPGPVNDLLKSGRVLHTATGSGVYASIDQASTWVSTTSGLTNTDVRALAGGRRLPRVLVAGTTSGVFVSGNHGLNWQPAVAALPSGSDSVNALAITARPAEAVLAATEGGVWKLSSLVELGCAAVPDAAFAAPVTAVGANDIGSVAGAWPGPYSAQKDLNEDGRNSVADIMLTASVFGAVCTP